MDTQRTSGIPTLSQYAVYAAALHENAGQKFGIRTLQTGLL
jgi:hypothetical protein